MKTWKILMIVLTIAILGFVTQPEFEKFQNLNSEKEKLVKIKKDKIAELQKLKAIETEIIETARNDLNQIPVEIDQENLIKDMLRITRKTGFPFSGLNFSKGMNSKLNIPQVSISFSTKGEKGKLLEFLREIENNERFLGMENFSISTEQDGIKRMVSLGVSLFAFYQDTSAE
ncbi:MAG: type 4a pilus biogenesis protein PilO [Candidatus Peregrinibacteria bacterium]|nr:type 4a pilus biogenesis protein PilO [Candidatus Peregrinibacteria bacterium]